MMRINRAQISFHGVSLGHERASAIVQRAFGQLATAPGHGATTDQPRVQLTVRVPHNASDAVIVDRLSQALRRRTAR